MPRSWHLTAQDNPQLKRGQQYPLRVAGIRKAGKNAILVELEHVSTEQAGRTHSLTLSLPVRPAGLTGLFFQSVGSSTEPGATIRPLDAVGKIVNVRFEKDTGVNDYRIIAFNPLTEDATDGK